MSASWHNLPVFVYGTLKSKQPNHGLLQSAIDNAKAVFLGRATTVDDWPMIVFSPFNIPYVLDCKGVGKPVIGELYRVDTDTLGSLDKLENHPHWYTRDRTTARLVSSPSETIECELYVMHDFRRTLLTMETFISEYTDTVERRYVKHADRPVGYTINIKETASTG